MRLRVQALNGNSARPNLHVAGRIVTLPYPTIDSRVSIARSGTVEQMLILIRVRVLVLVVVQYYDIGTNCIYIPGVCIVAALIDLI